MNAAFDHWETPELIRLRRAYDAHQAAHAREAGYPSCPICPGFYFPGGNPEAHDGHFVGVHHDLCGVCYTFQAQVAALQQRDYDTFRRRQQAGSE